MRARLNPVFQQAHAPRLLCLALLAALVLTIGCASLTSGGSSAEIEPVNSKDTICIPTLAGYKMSAELPETTCPKHKQAIKLITHSNKPLVYKIVLPHTNIFLTQLKYCGKLYTPAAMLRQLFAGTQDVQIKSSSIETVQDISIKRSSSQIKIDQQPVAVESFSYEQQCYFDWIFWKTAGGKFSKAEKEISFLIFKKLWSSN